MTSYINTVEEFLEVLKKHEMLVEENKTGITTRERLKSTRLASKSHVGHTYNRADELKKLKTEINQMFILSFLFGKSNIDKHGICIDQSPTGVTLPYQDGVLTLAREIEKGQVANYPQLNRNKYLILDITPLLKLYKLDQIADLDIDTMTIALPKSLVVSLDIVATGALEIKSGYELHMLAYSNISSPDTIYKFK